MRLDPLGQAAGGGLGIGVEVDDEEVAEGGVVDDPPRIAQQRIELRGEAGDRVGFEVDLVNRAGADVRHVEVAVGTESDVADVGEGRALVDQRRRPVGGIDLVDAAAADVGAGIGDVDVAGNGFDRVAAGTAGARRFRIVAGIRHRVAGSGERAGRLRRGVVIPRTGDRFPVGGDRSFEGRRVAGQRFVGPRGERYRVSRCRPGDRKSAAAAFAFSGEGSRALVHRGDGPRLRAGPTGPTAFPFAGQIVRRACRRAARGDQSPRKDQSDELRESASGPG